MNKIGKYTFSIGCVLVIVGGLLILTKGHSSKAFMKGFQITLQVSKVTPAKQPVGVFLQAHNATGETLDNVSIQLTETENGRGKLFPSSALQSVHWKFKSNEYRGMGDFSTPTDPALMPSRVCFIVRARLEDKSGKPESKTITKQSCSRIKPVSGSMPSDIPAGRATA